VIADDLDTLDAQQLRDALRAARADAAFKQAVIDKLPTRTPSSSG
jgi:uncharacterized protein (DUF433 family)